MGPIDRVLSAIGGEPLDHPPLALSLALQGARVLDVPLPDVLRDPATFVSAQMAMHRRWRHEIALAMRYAGVEVEALGAAIAFHDDGPPNVASMLIRRRDELAGLRFPRVRESAVLQASLRVVDGMKEGLAGQALVAGVVVGPLSGPVMLMGMEPWLLLVMTEPQVAAELVARYADFAMDWAQSQLERGADVLVWFEPLASHEMLPGGICEALAGPPLRQAFALGAPIVLHLASARTQRTIPFASAAGVSALSIGRADDPAKLAEAAAGKVALVGGIDGVALTRYSEAELRAEVAAVRARFPRGLVMSDLHGEIPYQVHPGMLDVLVEATRS